MTKEAFMQETIADKKRKWLEVRRRKKEDWGRTSTTVKTRDWTEARSSSKMHILNWKNQQKFPWYEIL